MTPLEPWKRVFVSEEYLETAHGKMSCTWCHNGNPQSPDKEEGHKGIIAYPSEDADFYCGPCHAEEVKNNKISIHTTQEGYFERFRIRAGYDWRDPGREHELEEFKAECGVCHATCGQCHISRPRTVGGGFNWAHEFKKTPDLQTNCTACHGSRIGEEYTGAHEGFKADVHYIPHVKNCEYCHPAHQMHGGDGKKLTYRYDEHNTAAIRCEDCHDDTIESNQYHLMHWAGEAGVVHSCEVCHSQPYKNCNGCHAGGGITGSSYLSFEIGRNYLKDNRRYKDYDYITVRHIPIAPNTYEEWGIEDLKYFEFSEPTWKFTRPHNTLLWTPQTEVAEGQSCNANCHDSAYLLRPEDIEYYEDANYKEENGEFGYGFDDLERERLANKDVIIPYK